MERYQESIANKSGNPIAGASVVVQDYPSGTLATIYASNSTADTPIVNSELTTDADGEFFFYALSGRYQLVISGELITGKLYEDITLADTEEILVTEASKVGADDGASGTLWIHVQGLIDYLLSQLGSSFIGHIDDGVGASPTTVQAELRRAGYTDQPLSQFAATTSAQLAGVLSDETGTGLAVFSNSPVLVTPNLGTPSTLVGTNITGTGVGFTAGAANGFASLTTVVNVSGSAAPTAGQVLKATSSTTATWQADSLGGDALVANPLSQFASTSSAQLASIISDETGTGVLVFSTSPTLVTPDLGTPSALVGTNITGTAAGLTVGLASVANGIKNATSSVSVSSAAAPTPGQVLTATNSFTATWQTHPGGGDALTTNPLSQFASTTSAQLAGVLSDETGTGSVVFATSPVLVTPNLGTPSTLIGTNISGTAPSLTAGNATNTTLNTGLGSTYVKQTSPVLITPNLGTPSALVGTNITGTGASFTSGTSNALESATTTVSVSAATAPTVNQVLTATSGTTATWQDAQVGAGSMDKATYDPFTKAGDAFDMDNMEEGLTKKILTTAERSILAATSGTNTGDQTSIVGITGTIAQFNTALTDGSFATGGGTATGTNTGDQTSIGGLDTTTTTVDISSSAAPAVGDILIATSGSAATWQANLADGLTSTGLAVANTWTNRQTIIQANDYAIVASSGGQTTISATSTSNTGVHGSGLTGISGVGNPGGSGTGATGFCSDGIGVEGTTLTGIGGRFNNGGSTSNGSAPIEISAALLDSAVPSHTAARGSLWTTWDGYICVNMDGLTTWRALGLREKPQISKSTAYTLVMTDSGKHILHPSADTTARTYTIPANISVAYPIGTELTFVNQDSAGTLTIAITTDTMRLAGAGTTGSRTLAANGIAKALKISATEWIIDGTGLT